MQDEERSVISFGTTCLYQMLISTSGKSINTTSTYGGYIKQRLQVSSLLYFSILCPPSDVDSQTELSTIHQFMVAMKSHECRSVDWPTFPIFTSADIQDRQKYQDYITTSKLQQSNTPMQRKDLT